MYKNFFPGKRWDDLTKNLCKKLRSETALLTGLPQIGLTSYLKYVEETYENITKDEESIVIFFEIMPGQTKIFHISSKILKLLNYKLAFPKYLQDLSCEESFYEINKRGKGILIILNRFQELKKSPEAMIFLRTLRSVNLVKIRYLLGSDISSLTQPTSFKTAGILASANLYSLPTLNLNEVRDSIRNYKKMFDWSIPLKFSEQVLYLSGGICGLVKYISKSIHDNDKELLGVSRLLQDPAINYKTTEIFESLKKNDLLDRHALDLSKADILHKLGVIDENKKLRIKLLEPLLKKPEDLELQDLNKLLSAQELKLFQLFESDPEKIFSLDEMSNHIWEDQVVTKYSPWAIYKLISNLNNKLPPLGLRIENYRGRGYQLIKIKK